MAMDREAKKAAAEALTEKVTSILAQKEKNTNKINELAARNRDMDRELADCRVTARVLGLDIEFPPGEAEARHFNLHLRNYFSALTGDPREKAAAEVDKKQEMPRVSDLVLDRLKAAGSNGTKAAPIQASIESTYARKLHPKTVGMTLFRLQKHKLVTRKGHTWFIVDQTVNPGAGAPGSVTKSQK